eukprot:39158-Rhodomonas_salina.4
MATTGAEEEMAAWKRCGSLERHQAASIPVACFCAAAAALPPQDSISSKVFQEVNRVRDGGRKGGQCSAALLKDGDLPG